MENIMFSFPLLYTLLAREPLQESHTRRRTVRVAPAAPAAPGSDYLVRYGTRRAVQTRDSIPGGLPGALGQFSQGRQVSPRRFRVRMRRCAGRGRSAQSLQRPGDHVEATATVSRRGRRRWESGDGCGDGDGEGGGGEGGGDCGGGDSGGGNEYGER